MPKSEPGEAGVANAGLSPTYRMRVAFEGKIVAPYRDTYRGELGQAQVELLYMRGTMHQYELVNELRTSKQHVSKMTSRLEQMGYVARSVDDADARGHVVVLTDAGHAYVGRHIAEGSKRARELYSHLSDTERRELDQAMLTVARLLEKA